MHRNKYSKRSMFLLLPVGLLAIASYALDKRIPLDIDYNLQSILMQIFRIVLPGIFAICVACLMPTSNRFFQLLAVGFNYSILSSISLSQYSNLFTQPTAWIIASLSATLFLLPSNDKDSENENVSFFTFLYKLIGIIVMPTLTLIGFVVIVKNIEHSIFITFTSVFVESVLACLFVPIYEIMLTLGFSASLNSLVSLQVDSETVNAILNSIILTNIIALPALIFTRAMVATQYNRFFLVLLAIITCLSSRIGACVSIELAILLFFFPGTLIVLCTSSILIFFVSYYLQLATFTNFYMLYEPDLILKNLTLLHVTPLHYYAIVMAIIIPPALQLFFSKLGVINTLKNTLRSNDKIAGIKFNQMQNPDLMLIAILKNVGGISNICGTSSIGNELYVKVHSLKKVSTFRLSLLGKNRISYLRAFNEIKFNLGAQTKTIYKRMSNIILESQRYSQNVIHVAKPFNIDNHLKELQENAIK